MKRNSNMVLSFLQKYLKFNSLYISSLKVDFNCYFYNWYSELNNIGSLKISENKYLFCIKLT